jgi:V/A-type H+-transporting ATPase subunit I
LGICLLAAGHVLGIVNRWREGGARAALGDVSGVPGLALLAAAALVAAGTAGGAGGPAVAAGAAAAVVAVAMLAVGLRAEAGDGALAIVQVIVGLFDALVRLFSNVVSFARLAAFGLMHAALAKVVLDAAGAMAGSPAGDVAAVIAFVLGGALAFTLEGVVAAAQALRLEYYELFSRMFVREGRPFAPWKLPLSPGGEAP